MSVSSILRPLVCALAVAFGLSGCSLMDFSLEGVSCHPLDNPCLSGYGCVDGQCIAGADAGIDCSTCPTGECLPGTNECRPFSCDGRPCRAGYKCEIINGVPECPSVGEGMLGQFCYQDSDCRRSGDPAHQNRGCLRGAVQLATTGDLRSGVCVEPCASDDTCPAEGSECRTFTFGIDAGVTKACLPRYALSACARDSDCSGGKDPLVCTVFDHADIGPLTACDMPLAEGAGTGAACVRSPSAGGALCANGLCVPQSPTGSQQAFCGEPCDEGTCTLGTCQRVEFAVDTVVRYVPMCVVNPSRCGDCSAGAQACRADAPWCTTFGGDQVCLGACSPSATGDFQCPPGYACEATQSGNRCTPVTGSCQ